MTQGVKISAVAAFCGAIAGALAAIVYQYAYADGLLDGAAIATDSVTAAAADRNGAGE